MLSFLLLVSGGDAPLSADHLARLARWPGAALAHRPERTRMWLSPDRRVGFVGWRSGPGGPRRPGWHIGPQGLTAVRGSLWPVVSATDVPASIEALGAWIDPSTPERLAGVGGVWSLLRIAPDGSGSLVSDPGGAGAVHVAREGEVVALSDRAELAASALGEARRTCHLDELSTLGVQDAGDAWKGTRTVPAGRWLRLSPGRGVELHDRPGPPEPTPLPHDVIASVVEAAARWPGQRIVDLDGEPGSAVVAAAIRSTSTAARFRFRAVGTEADRRAAASLARVLGVELEQSPRLRIDTASSLELRVRRLVASCETAVVPPFADRLRAADPTALVLHSSSATSDPRVAARIAGAALQLAGGADRLDPLWAAGPVGGNGPAAPELLARLAPDGDIHLPEAGSQHDGLGWEHVGPLLESRRPLTTARLGREGGHADLVDRLRAGDALDGADRRRAWALLAATLWLDGASPAEPPPRHNSRVAPASPVKTPPTLVTGVTSRSLAQLLDLDIPREERRHDPLLGIEADGPLADLCSGLLLAVGATEIDQPDDLADQLASDATAGHADEARSLLERRGGILADARLGLLLPFWTAHVHPEPRLVLVDERPAELSAMSLSVLPETLLLGLWTDVVVGTLLSDPLPRVVDPRDVGPVDVPEGAAPRGVAPSDALQLAAVVDGLIRELDRDEIAPLLRSIGASRSRRRGPAGAGYVPERVVDVVGELWAERRHLQARVRQADGETAVLAARLARLEEELTGLRGHPAVRLALRLPGAARPER